MQSRPPFMKAHLMWRGGTFTVQRRFRNDSKLNNKREAQALVTIYKVCPASAWREAERQGVYRGSADDQRDGFIHLSKASQLEGTLARHFAGQNGLFLIAIDADILGDAVRWEPSRNRQLFPHLYGDLDPGAVLKVMDIHTKPDGTHSIPDLAP